METIIELARKDQIAAIAAGRKTQFRQLLAFQPHCPRAEVIRIAPRRWQVYPRYLNTKDRDRVMEAPAEVGDRLLVPRFREIPPQVLLVTEIWTERLQDITEANAAAVVVERVAISPDHINGIPVHPMTSTHKEAFRKDWDSVMTSHPWDYNPMVWAIKFLKLTEEEE